MRKPLLSKEIPSDSYDPERKAVKRIMKSVQGPYPKFTHYYPLENVIDLYMELWYEDSSDSD